MGEPFRHRLRVRYHECDPQGIVFNANYLAYHDIATFELWREAFGSWEVFVADSGVDIVVAEARVRFLSPLRFDDEAELVLTVPRIGTTSLVMASRVDRSGQTAAEVEVRYVALDPESHQPTPVPDRVREILERYAADEAGARD